MLDASITLAWCFQDQVSPLAEAALERLVAEGALVPELWPFEVANALRGAERRERITQAQAIRFGQLLGQRPITVEEPGPERILGSVLALARTASLTVYDAAYLALALEAGMPLATADEQLAPTEPHARAGRGHPWHLKKRYWAQPRRSSRYSHNGRDRESTFWLWQGR